MTSPRAMLVRPPAIILLLASVATLDAAPALAFDSGSTGADGALCIGDKKRSEDGLSCVPDDGAQTDDVTVALPPSGVLHYTTVWVGSGSTLRFARNQANTPVYLLATGEIAIRGTIDVSGKPGTCAYAGSYIPSAAAELLCWGGLGGPGGDPGGSIGPIGGSAGLGPGGSLDGITPGAGGEHGGAPDASVESSICAGGGGAGPTLQGQFGGCRADGICMEGGGEYAEPGWKYTHGGSGGGGAYMYWGAAPTGAGEVEAGGGGGGAILIASSTRVALYQGIIVANGAARSYVGGGGGGGLIRLVAPIVTSYDGASAGTAYLSATSSCQYLPWATAPFCTPFVDAVAGCGAPGVIEIETWDMSELIVSANPADVRYAAPRRALPWGEDAAAPPSLTITSVEAIEIDVLPTTLHPHRHPVLTIPTGVSLTVEIEAKNVPLDAQVVVGVNTVGRGREVVAADPLVGTVQSSITHAEITLPADTKLGDLQAWIEQITVVE